MDSSSHIYYSDDYDSTVWKLLVRNTDSLDDWAKAGMNFIIIGTDLQGVVAPGSFGDLSDGNPVLAIAALSNGQFSEAGRDMFMRSLQPHSFNEAKYEVQFNNLNNLNIKLNVYNLFYRTLSKKTILIENPERLFYEYYKSGTMLTFSTCATIYGGGSRSNQDNGYPGPILQKSDGSYRIQINYSGRVYQLYIGHC